MVEPVHYEFSLHQDSGPTWHVVRISCDSELSQVYEIRLDLVCDDEEPPVDEMLGASCDVLVERGESIHTMYGIIAEIDDVGPDQERFHASVRVIPAFGLLANQIDTRIFQGQTVIDILTDVLSGALEVYGRKLDASSCIQRQYHKRDYCTQFRESTLDFCCRLMEEEGIAFYFAPDDESRCEMLVLIDNNSGYPLADVSGSDEVPIIEHNPDEGDSESIQGLLWRQRHHVNKVAGRAYNFKSAGGFDEYEDALDEEHNHQPYESYLHDLRRQITDDPIGDPNAESFDGTDLLQRQKLVEQVLQEHRTKTKTGQGRGNVTGFHPGLQFRVGEHHREDLDGSPVLIVRVRHVGEAPEGSRAGGASYANEFTVIPIVQEFRPPRRIPQPRVYGSQLAKVVGPEGQEIHTDKYGRIKIQFHHDRLQPPDETASCWVRVVQPWAGPQWGSFFIPRIGMEVMVQFVDGNPDNPVVVGTVYNSENIPPYPMPDEKTKSTIKSSSSSGGNGYNELTFEDAAGAEQIIIHAQKDLNETVENNHTTTVHANQTDSVDGNQSISVGGDQSISVTGDHTETVTGKATVTVHKTRDTKIDQDNSLKVGGNHAVMIDGGATVDIGGKRSLTVAKATTQLFKQGLNTTVLGANDSLTVEQNKGVSVSGTYTITSTGAYQVTQKGTESIKLDSSINITSGSRVEIKNDKCTMTMEGGVLKLEAPESISFKCGDASIGLKSDGTIEIKGNTKVSVEGGGAKGEWSEAGATLSGNMLELSANAVAKLSGTMVKIN